MAVVQVYLVDRQLAFAQIVAARLDAVADITVVGTANDQRSIEAVLGAASIDVLVIDATIGSPSGSAVVTAVRRRAPGQRIVLLTGADDAGQAIEALAAGATGLVNRRASFDDLLAAIRSAACGETWVTRLLLTEIFDQLLRRPPERASHALDQLTERERDVLECLASGMNRAAIARSLFVSLNTVRTHTGNLLAKLGAHSTLEAVAIARDAGMREGTRSPRPVDRP